LNKNILKDEQIFVTNCYPSEKSADVINELFMDTSKRYEIPMYLLTKWCVKNRNHFRSAPDCH